MKLTEVVAVNEEKSYSTNKKEVDTMMSVAKPRERAFVLSSKKANVFLKQNQ